MVQCGAYMRAGLIWGQRLLKFRKNHFEEIPPLFLSKEQYQKQLNILEIMSMSLALSQWESSDCLGHKPLHNTRGPYRAQVFQMGTVLLIRGVVLIQYFVVIKALIWGRRLFGGGASSSKYATVAWSVQDHHHQPGHNTLTKGTNYL